MKWTSTDAALALPVAVAAFVVSRFSYPLAYWGTRIMAGQGLPGADVSWMIVGPTLTMATVFDDFLNGFDEELIVRAYLMTEVLRLTKSGWVAVLCSVVVQVSYHLYQGVPVALGHIGWCLLFSLFYLKTRRILPLALAHNFTNFTLLLQDAARAAAPGH